MYFCEDASLQEIERLMRRIPNFSPRGHGIVIVCSHEYSASDCDCRICSYHTGRGKKTGCSLERCACMKERIESGAASQREIIAETMSVIQYQPLLIRLEKYLKESEDSPMDFKNEKHRAVFADAVLKLDKKNYALMAAIYLLTAELKVWNAVRHFVEKNEIQFAAIHLKGSTENGYTLYCAAKDLYLGTKNLTVSDLADTELIPPKIFGLICNAMAIRRFGLGAVHFKAGGEQK